MSSTALYDDAPEERSRTVAELLESPRWALAAPLAERLAAWRRRGSPRGPIDRDLAAKRLERWKTQTAFAKNPGLWDERLAAAGMSEEELRYLLGETAEQAREHADRPEWLDAIAAAYGDGGRTAELDWPDSADLARCRFHPIAEPLVSQFRNALEDDARAILARHPDAPFGPEIARTLTSHLPDHLAPLLNRAMLVELHVLKLEDALEGETPEARFESFLETLRDKTYALEILERYPVLARQLVLRLSLWRDACAELLRRLASDAHLLNGGRPLGRLTAVHGALSDFHRGGRSVFILVFDSGFEVVYKPKPLALEVAFQDLLRFLNDRGFEPALRPLGVIDRGEYGWIERVWPAPCDDDAALQRFLERQGAYLALLYVLDGTDFHHENLLAVGEHPVLIDLETLFQPFLNLPDLHDPHSAPGAPVRATVLRVNMLPERWWSDRNEAGVDLSGLTASGDQLTPRPMLAAADAGRDTMRMERRRMTIPAGDNRVRVRGREVAVSEFAAPIETGFRRLYALLSEHRQAFARQVATFAGREMRLLFRNTMHYGTVLLESLHPHALGNALDRDRLFDALWAVHPRRPFLRLVTAAERADLHDGDIPLFVTTPESRDALHWRGERYADLLPESGLARVQRRIAELSPLDCERQVAVIRDSFDALRLGTSEAKRASYAFAPRAKRADADELLALACNAADRIAERAFTDSREALWLTLDYREPNGWQLVPSGPDFYLGLPGIAFFLGHLGAATGEARYTDLARKALVTQRLQLAADPSNVKGLGGFNGWGGILYALAHLGRLWNEPSLFDEAESYAARLPQLVADDAMLDLIAGSAGLICSLSALADVRPSPSVDALLLACGERLVAKAEPQSRGLGWRMPLAGDRALAGISHGAAGIALALLRLYGRTGDGRFRDAAIGGIEFERSLFSNVEQNWPDLRAGADEGVTSSDGLYYMLAWCHGAPGIGLARIAGLPWLDDGAVREEIDVAVRSTRASFGENHSLCHGDPGNLELLFTAARLYGDRDLEDEAWRIAGGIADSIRRDGWLLGLPGNIETPGLMAGLAGAGYGLARIARPDLFPRVLTLDS